MPSKNNVCLMLGRRLRASRVAIGFDLKDFAEELGIPVGEYENIEAGRGSLDLETLVYAARIVGKSLDFLLTGRPFQACG